VNIWIMGLSILATALSLVIVYYNLRDSGPGRAHQIRSGVRRARHIPDI